MDSREKVMRILDRKNTDKQAMWTGNPNDLTVPIYADEWGIENTREAIFDYLKDDCRWFMTDACYAPDIPMWDFSFGIDKRKNLSSEGCFAGFENYDEIPKDYPWPTVNNLNFDVIYNEIDKHQDKMVFTGMWCPFFHVLCDYLGMENYFCMMYENPKFVEALTERVVDFYVEANDKFLNSLGERADVIFFGNDFGTQRDLFISPENWRRFILPSYIRIIAVGKKYGKKIMTHSCGAVQKIIPDMIDAGIDALHPLQAQAEGMCAENLAQYKMDLTFVGGIDAQSFFVNATPQEIRDEVKRVQGILGPNLIVSPSHEEILPNVPAANILAMSEAIDR